MKLVINTQDRENYGAHDWDGKGECPQYWKAKGGDTYVIRDLTPNQACSIAESGIPHLTSLLESRSEYATTEIISWDLRDNDDYECEDWESVIELSYDRIAECWIATRTTHRDECWREGIDYKIDGWVLGPNGQQSHYKCTYYGAEA